MEQPTKAFLKARREYRTQTLRALRDVVKGTFWKKHSYMVYREAEPYFVVGQIRISEWDCTSTLSVGAKPSKIDDVFWDIFGIPENSALPRSLKAVGTFTCPIPTPNTVSWSDDGLSPAENATEIAEAAESLGLEATGSLMGRSYANFIHEWNAASDAGDYAMTLIAALVLEGRLAEARSVADDYASGSKRARLVFSHSMSETFFTLAAKRLREHGA